MNLPQLTCDTNRKISKCFSSQVAGFGKGPYFALNWTLAVSAWSLLDYRCFCNNPFSAEACIRELAVWQTKG